MCVCVDSLLRGCRLRRRIFHPDDVILGVVGTLTSRDTGYGSLARDWRGGRRAGTDSSMRRHGRNSSSLVRVDSGLDSLTVSPSSPAFTDDVRDELVVSPAPAMSLEPQNSVPAAGSAAQHFDANSHTESFQSNVADAQRSGVMTSGRDDKENSRLNDRNASGSMKQRKKRKVKKTKKDLNSSRTSTEKPSRDERSTHVHDESLWEFNGDKLWRFCAEMLRFGSRLPASERTTVGEVARSAPAQTGILPGLLLF